MLFSNRDKFDLVAIYDDSSDSYGGPNTPLSVLVRAIYEVEFQKMLKRMPVLILGGFRGWKKDIGEDGIARGGVSQGGPESNKPIPVPGSAAGPPDPHKLWTPQLKGDSSISPSDNKLPHQSLDLPGSSQFDQLYFARCCGLILALGRSQISMTYTGSLNPLVIHAGPPFHGHWPLWLLRRTHEILIMS